MDLASLIAEFLDDAREGRVRDTAGRRYTTDGLRDLRAAFSHVSSELGNMDVQEVRNSDLESLVHRLRVAGLSPERSASLSRAIDSLFAYALDRELLAESPLAEPPAPVGRQHTPPARVAAEGPSPTETMLALGEVVTSWLVKGIVIAFVLVMLALLVELL